MTSASTTSTTSTLTMNTITQGAENTSSITSMAATSTMAAPTTSASNTEGETNSTKSNVKESPPLKSKSLRAKSKRKHKMETSENPKIDMDLFEDYVQLLRDKDTIPNQGGAEISKLELIQNAKIGQFFVDYIVSERNGKMGVEYLVRWVGYKDTTWERAENIPQSDIDVYNSGKQ